MPPGLTIFALRVIEYLTKLLVPDMRNCFLICWFRETKRFSKQYRLLLLPLVTSQRLKVSF